MNWFMYIGGGIIFLWFSLVLLKSFFLSDIPLDEVGRYMVFVWAFASILIWVWVCWEFIK